MSRRGAAADAVMDTDAQSVGQAVMAADGAVPPTSTHRPPALVTSPIRRTVLMLALPVLGEQLLNTLVGLVDTFLSGRISVDATAAVGLASYVGWLMAMLFMLVGTGTTALVSRAIGAGRPDEANHVANQSFTLATFNGLIGAAFIYALAPSFATWQNMRGSTYDITVDYLRIEAIGHAFTSMTLVGGAALRGVGDMRTPLKVLSIVNAVNVILSPALVWGVGPLPDCGVNGIVLGTVIARIGGAILMVTVLARGKSGLKLHATMLAPVWNTIRRVLWIGIPAAGEGAVMWIGQFFFLLIIARLAEGEVGKAFYAAHFIGVRLESLTYLPAVAWAAAAATMIGQALGAGVPRRAKRVGHEAALQCALLALASTILFIIFAPQIMRAMHDSPLVREVGVPALRLVALFQPCMAFSIVYLGAMRGAGATRYPLLITIITMLLFRLPIAYVCGIVLQGGLIGAWAGMVTDMTLRATLATLRYRRGEWLHVRV